MTDGVPAPELQFKIGLNVLNHLGLNLYSTIPAVLTEAVANAWDAGAQRVSVAWKTDDVPDPDDPTGATKKQRIREITIFDDGVGMSRQDVIDRYLTVGYERRKATSTVVSVTKPGSPPITVDRPVMGRKGIGKLSLFSIAAEVKVETTDGTDKCAFRMRLDGIQEAIKAAKDGDAGTYRPESIPTDGISFAHGTRITLTEMRRTMYREGDALKRQLARRFSVIGPRHLFEIEVQSTPLTPADRGYFHKVEYLWYLSPAAVPLRPGGSLTIEGSTFDKLATVDGNVCAFHRPGVTHWGRRVTGWIGTVAQPSELKDADNLNRIVLMVRGRVAHEDLLVRHNDGELYTKYIVGELHADFLDDDSQEDITTSSRQSIVESDERFIDVEAFLKTELRNIANEWSQLRTSDGVIKASEIPEVKAWLLTLGKDDSRKAKSFLGKINALALTDAERRRLFLQGVIAFESFRYRNNLDSLDDTGADNIPGLLSAFGEVDAVEAILYHQIVQGRLKVIETLKAKVDENALETVIQQYLFEHLWLLDPSWERATETPILEQAVSTAFAAVDSKLSEEERKGRLDIRYQKVSGIHVVVELKRPDRKVTADELAAQIGKYTSALRKVLTAAGRPTEPVEAICLVGKPIHDPDDPQGLAVAIQTLKAKNARHMTYLDMLDSAQQAYTEFLTKRRDLRHLDAVIQALGGI